MGELATGKATCEINDVFLSGADSAEVPSHSCGNLLCTCAIAVMELYIYIHIYMNHIKPILD